MKKTKTRTRMKKMRNRARLAQVCALLMLVSFAAQPVSAIEKQLDPKQPYALIFGTVFGPDNRPIPGVKIKIRREGDKKPVDLVSDARGEFAHRFPAGAADYVIWADLKDKQAAQNS